MDVCLMNYGHCNYVSGKHACIFYDEVTDANASLSPFVPVMTKKVLMGNTLIGFFVCVRYASLYFLEYKAVRVAELQRAWDNGGQRAVLL